MIKTFVTTIPMQTGQGLTKGVYEPQGNLLFTRDNMPVSFPIIPIMREFHREDKEFEPIQIIVVCTENEACKTNLQKFAQELAEAGIRKYELRIIYHEENQSMNQQMKLLMNLVQEIPERSQIYADVTFGTKPMSMLLLCAMNMIESLKETEVAGIFYGEIVRETRDEKSFEKERRIYDMTSYKLILDVVSDIKNMNVEQPYEWLRSIIED